jgi:hypothetical protein
MASSFRQNEHESAPTPARLNPILQYTLNRDIQHKPLIDLKIDHLGDHSPAVFNALRRIIRVDSPPRNSIGNDAVIGIHQPPTSC